MRPLLKHYHLRPPPPRAAVQSKNHLAPLPGGMGILRDRRLLLVSLPCSGCGGGVVCDDSDPYATLVVLVAVVHDRVRWGYREPVPGHTAKHPGCASAQG